MFRTTSLCSLLIGGLAVFALAQDSEVNKADNVVPLDDWNVEPVEAVMKARAEAKERGRTAEEVRVEVDYLMQLYAKHVRDDNCGAVINLYHPEITLMSYSGEVMKGLEAVHFTLSGVESMNVTTLAVTPLGEDANFVFHHSHTAASDGKGNPLYNGESFTIWKRTKDGHKIFMEIYDESALTM
ncbi:uncharacterized protein LOC110980583 [Acanthaster planci]|uniref:Uncharacterized protein LOC110980583 n=1 Tax=Acanthaster planci TaxID=133434 RepID=A0A8B7YIM8_ACAPL|nr:uncharacterized protein LOC110980583 [Acanthaster planci]